MDEVVERLLNAKEKSGLTFEEIARELGRNPEPRMGCCTVVQAGYGISGGGGKPKGSA